MSRKLILTMQNILSKMKGFDCGNTTANNKQMIVELDGERFLISIDKIENPSEHIFEDIEKYLEGNSKEVFCPGCKKKLGVVDEDKMSISYEKGVMLYEANTSLGLVVVPFVCPECNTAHTHAFPVKK